MHLILRISKLEILRVPAIERFFVILLFTVTSPKDRFSWPENDFIVFKI
jgi:hypothetical protein